MNWQIAPLELAWLSPVPASAVGWPASIAQSFALPVYAYLVRRGTDVVLFDCGPPPPREAEANGHPNVHSRWRGVVDALNEEGVRPADVNAVVLSHLHWDHVYGASQFPHAEIIVQKAEVDFWADSPEKHSRAYDSGVPGSPTDRLLESANLHIVDGHHALMDGLEIIPTPGHTRGSQSMIVAQENGTAALCGDLVHLLENFVGSDFSGGQPFPAGISDREGAWRASLHDIARREAVPLIAHDSRALQALRRGVGLRVTRAGYRLGSSVGLVDLPDLGASPTTNSLELRRAVFW